MYNQLLGICTTAQYANHKTHLINDDFKEPDNIYIYQNNLSDGSLLATLLFNIEKQNVVEISKTDGKSCSLCGVIFSTLEEQVTSFFIFC